MLDPSIRALVVALVMAVLSPIMAALFELYDDVRRAYGDR